MNRNTLIVVTSAGSLPLLRYVGLKFVQQGRPCTILYMGPKDERFERLAAAVAGKAIELIAFADEVTRASECKLFVRNSSLRAFLVTGLAAALGGLMKGGLTKAIGIELAAADHLIKRVNPDSIVVAENGISGPMAFLSRASFLGIPIFAIPYGNARPHDLEIDLERKRIAGERMEPKGREKLLMQIAMRSWIKKGREKGATMFQPSYIVALEGMGITLRDPWIVQGGTMAALCAESSGSIAQYLSEGIPSEKIKLTGSPYCDEMVEAVRHDPSAAAALLKPVLINPSRPRILVSWPPNYHQTHVGKSEFNSYDEMGNRYFEVLASKTNCDVTVSLHPSAGVAGAKVMRDNGITPSSDHLVALIAQHDIFVSFFSSATRWAIAAGKPVLNIDLYDQQLPNFLHLEGVVHVRTLREFSDALDAISKSPEEFAKYAGPQVRAAPEFGIMDGTCVARIQQEVDRVRGSRWD